VPLKNQAQGTSLFPDTCIAVLLPCDYNFIPCITYIVLLKSKSLI